MSGYAMPRRRPFWARMLLWPIKALWRVITWVANATGILLALLLGLGLMIVGYVLTSTVLGAPVGVPLFILGFLLLIRALY